MVPFVIELKCSKNNIKPYLNLNNEFLTCLDDIPTWSKIKLKLLLKFEYFLLYNIYSKYTNKDWSSNAF